MERFVHHSKTGVRAQQFMEKIRNFSIVAHIDHGKSTLADRFIQLTGAVNERDFRDQFLDSMDIERERGITIKSQAITLFFKSKDGETYTLNLIDTPGHVDFTYEVSRALAACEGVLLLVDASQGVEAQTLANMYLAMENDLEIVPVINKIDLPAADIPMALEGIQNELGLSKKDALLCSAKAGTGVDEVLEAVVRRVPPPDGDADKRLSALIFDAHYDVFRGTVIYVRVMDGIMKAGDIIRFMSNNSTYKVEEVGIFRLKREPKESLAAGEVGYVIAGVKTVNDVHTGDTITLDNDPVQEALPGFRKVKPVVFSSLYPIASDDYEDLAEALEKYTLNDAAFSYEKETSSALGQGFRCGFLGLLHMDVVQERLEREFDVSLILTFPSVEFHFTMRTGEKLIINNPAHYPDPANITLGEEPFIRATIMMPERYLGAVMSLCHERRGVNSHLSYPSPNRVELSFELPLAEVVYDFYDRLKTITQGYGSFDYEIIGYRPSDLAKVDILVNGERVDALSMLVHKEQSRARAKLACDRLKDEIPRQMFKIAIQGAIGGTIIARSTISPFRKDVTAKCYGGDISRKRKLLEKQKKGKKRMKMVGQVMIPQSAFIAVLKSDE